MTTLRIAILDGDEVIAEGKKLLLETQSDFLLVYESGEAQTALVELPDQLIDVVVIEIRLRGRDGVSTAALLRERYESSGQECPRLILTTPYWSEEIQQAASDAGISRVISAENLATSLIAAVRGESI